MPISSTSLDDVGRLKELRALQLLVSPIEPEFDNLTQLASEICDTPVALISFVGQDQVWFKSRVGYDALHGPRDHAFCSHAVQGTGPLVVEDATADPRFQGSVYVQVPQGIRFYAGIPLVLSSGHAVGTLCVLDYKARNLSDKQLGNLKKLALQVTALIEAKRIALRLQDEDQNRLAREQRLDFVLQVADIGDWEMDLRTNVARRSLKHDQCFGYTEAVPQWGYDTFLAHVIEVDRARVDDCYQRAMSGLGTYDVEFRVRWPDQTLHWVWSKGRFYFDESGKPNRVAGILNDITGRKQTEEALQHTQVLLANAEKIGRVGGWEIDVQTRQVTWTESVYDIHELDYTDRLTVDEGINYYTPESQMIIGQAVQRAIEQGEPFDLELEIISAKGNRRSVNAVGKPDQARGKVLGFFQDITERKQAEMALKTSSAQLQLLETCVSRLNDIVLITEAEPFDGPGPRIVFVNDAFVRRTGYSREEVIGKTPRILQGAKTQREELDRIRTALQRWEPVRAELINYTKAGQEFWLELDIVPVANASGWYTHWIAVERDITDRKLAEDTLLESEIRHRSMFENNPQPMWVHDIETLAFLSVNDATVAQYGYSREELLQMTLRDFRSVEELENLYASLALDLQSSPATTRVATHVRRDGTKIEVEVSSHAIEFRERPARLVLAHDITERLQSQARVHHLAFHDILTGLPNRVQFLNVANQMLRNTGAASQLSAVVLLDLDNFKSINDHWGHRCGDELLKLVAQRIQQCLPEAAFLARLGGDEFAVVAANIGVDQVAASIVVQDFCSKILVVLAKGHPIDQREHFTSASLGIALFGDVEITIDELLSRADSAMYSAKADGRNTFRFFDGQLQAKLAAQTELENDLRQAIQNDELHLVYQPQVDQYGKIVGSEALLRWTHPLRGQVSPAQFIPTAESNGFILEIGKWVLHTACMALAEWQSSSATAGLTLAVNVSAKQFHHPDFVSQVLSELEISGANPVLLKLELTESLLAQDLDSIIQKMNALKVKGVTFSLDDFGTGYSSLAYLKRLPLDQLKIDQGFVRDVLVDVSDATIVRTVVALGDSFGLNVIAEGVETQAQREFLQSNGCYSYQGYLFSRPLQKEDFEAFCARGFTRDSASTLYLQKHLTTNS